MRERVVALARKHRGQEAQARALHDKLYGLGAFRESRPHGAIAGWHGGFAYELEQALKETES